VTFAHYEESTADSRRSASLGSSIARCRAFAMTAYHSGGVHMTRLGMSLIALAVLPAMLTAQADTSRHRGTDTSRSRHQRVSSGAMGRSVGRNYGLTHDQVTQLQTALQQANCDPGPIDGVLGPRTQQAMNCARQKNNISGNNPNDLFRSLNLNFTTADSLGRTGGRGMDRVRGDSTMRRPMRGDSAMRRRPTRSDSLRRPPSTRKDTTPRPYARY
jgi:hypothetical protein